MSAVLLVGREPGRRRALAEVLQKDVRAFSREALRLLRLYEWPGNVRQIQSVVESAVVAAMGDTVPRASTRRARSARRPS